MRTLQYILLLSALSLAATQAGADTLQIKAAPAIELALPAKGLSMRQVQRQFGSPVEQVPAIGDPPIARWVYRDYTVYFEHQYVIHAVPHDR